MGWKFYLSLPLKENRLQGSFCNHSTLRAFFLLSLICDDEMKELPPQKIVLRKLY